MIASMTILPKTKAWFGKVFQNGDDHCDDDDTLIETIFFCIQSNWNPYRIYTALDINSIHSMKYRMEREREEEDKVMMINNSQLMAKRRMTHSSNLKHQTKSKCNIEWRLCPFINVKVYLFFHSRHHPRCHLLMGMCVCVSACWFKFYITSFTTKHIHTHTRTPTN